MSLEINEEVKSILKAKGISLTEGIPFLLSTYYEYFPSYFPDKLKRKIYSTNIFTFEYEVGESPKLVWKVPLFKGQAVDHFDWITQFMDMFGKINPDRRGARSYVVDRMKKLFAKYPDIRKDEVLDATRHYLNTVENPIYVLKSHKFISNTQGTPLLDTIMELRDKKISSSSNININPFKKII